MAQDPQAAAEIEVGRLKVLPHRREVLVDGSAIEIADRAFDLLMVLVEAGGDLVTKDTILRRVWPSEAVGENKLHTQISILRKALGKDREMIRTDSGRGYRLVAEADIPQPVRETAAPPDDARRRTNIPEPVSALIGREAELSDIVRLVEANRLVTLTGPGGIGKTRLGVEVARRLRPKFPDGAWIVELAPLSNPDLVAPTIGSALGLGIADGAAIPERVAAAIGSRHLLLVLDNCEHVALAASDMAEALLRANPAIHILVTSREPLRAEGEHVLRVPPLAVPMADSLDTEGLLRHGAVELFFARLLPANPRVVLDADTVAAASAICRRLDGIPLAIELAASRAVTLGVREVAARLDNRFGLLTGGRRTALPRHQTLRATMDWSYDMLVLDERVTLQRIAIFAGPFTLEAANAVVAGICDAADTLPELVSRSLVSAEFDGLGIRYRLLETTRVYALEKLRESGEQEEVARRHADYLCAMFERAEAELAVQSYPKWLVAYGFWIDDVRAALDWALAPNGDAALAVVLTAAAVPLWFNLSLMEECRRRVERAIGVLESGASRDTRREMQLCAALGTALIHTRGLAPEALAAWTRVLEIAKQRGEGRYELQALHGLWSFRNNGGDFRTALEIAQAFYAIAETQDDSAELLIADRMLGVTLHYLGEQADARLHIERMVRSDAAVIHPSNTVRLLIDHKARAIATLARILWLQGFPDQAMRTARRAVELAGSSIDRVTSLCYALAQAAAPVAMLTGDLVAAEQFVTTLLEHSAKHALSVWQTRGRCFTASLRILRGDAAGGTPLLRSALEELSDRGSGLYCSAFLYVLAKGFGAIGQPAQGLSVVDQSMERAEGVGDRWCLAEVLRVRGELLLSEDGPGSPAAAEACFLQALQVARAQGALSWELRAAMSLVRLRHGQGRTGQGPALLAPIYGRFTEGFGTADLRAAKSLIDDPAHA